MKILKRHTSKVTAIETTFDYKFVFSGDIQGKLIVWDYENENIVNQKQMSASISLLKYDRVWSRVLALIKGLEVVIWSFNDDNASMVEIKRIPKIFNSFFIFKNSEYFLLEEHNAYISIYKMETNEFMREFKPYGSINSNFVITDDTLNGYFGSNNKVIKCLTMNNQSQKIYEHKYSVKLLDISIDQKKLVSCTIFSINIWDIKNDCLLQFVDHVGKVINVSFDFNNFLTSQGKSVGLFNLGENKHWNLFNVHKGVILNAFSSPDNSKIIALGLDSTVRVWNSENLKAINHVYLSEQFFTEIRLLKSKTYYVASCKSYIMIMKFSDLIESTAKYNEEIPKDPAMSENFVHDDWNKEAYEGMVSFRF